MFGEIMKGVKIIDRKFCHPIVLLLCNIERHFYFYGISYDPEYI